MIVAFEENNEKLC